MYVFHTGPQESCHMNRDAYSDLVWAGDTTGYGRGGRGITFLLTYCCNRIFIFFFVALCLLASLTDLFVCLTHHGVAVLMTSLTVPSTKFWQWSKQPEDPIHWKSAISWKVTVIISSTEPMWATYAILDSNRIIESFIVSTSFAEG